MGIFSRFRDIVSSNINAILDKAEDPEKMVRLMIQEMEDTLIELKSSCAGFMAEQKRLERGAESIRAEAAGWQTRAGLAVQKGRDDLARAALAEKLRQERRAENLAAEAQRAREMATTLKDDIAQLERKLSDARDKQRSIIQRHSAAVLRKDAQTRIRQVDTTEAFAKFEAYENGIERLEAEAGLVDSLRPKDGALREQFAGLERDEDVERELEELKQGIRK